MLELSPAAACDDQIIDVDGMVGAGEVSKLPEFGLVGMGICVGFSNTEELHALTCEQAMESSQHHW